MTIYVNNDPTIIDDSINSVAALIQYLYPDTAGNVAIAKDNKLILRSTWNQVSVNENDEFTIITAAFGG
ncbi:MAG: sulfur carrier protein ThiS [Bacteroidales bacterium]|nr:sulfur carrier protein ThiS [Bacteroidales bacterium]MDE7464933.1 MoaD/ThiS family protein [Muribaculaceae bacterium]